MLWRFVAIGLVTLVFSLVLFFTFQDGWILLTGKLLAFSIIRRFYFLHLAALASLFSALLQSLFGGRAFPESI